MLQEKLERESSVERRQFFLRARDIGIPEKKRIALFCLPPLVLIGRIITSLGTAVCPFIRPGKEKQLDAEKREEKMFGLLEETDTAAFFWGGGGMKAAQIKN